MLGPTLRQCGAFRATTRRFARLGPWQAAARRYSIKPEAASTSKPQEMDASKLVVSETQTPGAIEKPEDLVFGRSFTGRPLGAIGTHWLTAGLADHMVTIEWNKTDGWLAPRITPYRNLSLDPATCVFHYAFECFEGMKAYKDKNGNIRLFRPDKNMARLN